MTDISVIINLHHEGRIAVPALRSVARAVETAAAAGLVCETIAVVDRGDEPTLRALRRVERPPRIETCDFGDPSPARNFGIAQAKGLFVAFLDGDDLMGDAWLKTAAASLLAREGRDVVVHPRMNYVFGRDVEPLIWLHPDMERDPADLTMLRAGNFWTNASFARADLYRRFPFRPNALEAGLGHEDWVFNLATVHAGVTHIAPEGTIHFIRRKAFGSRLAESDGLRVLPNFDLPLVGAETRKQTV